jgi:hypothetical protein
LNAFAERLAVYKLHCDEVQAVMLSNFVNVGDIRMIQGGCGLRLLSEPSHSILIGGNFDGKHFDCDLAMQLRIFRQIHLTHATDSEL